MKKKRGVFWPVCVILCVMLLTAMPVKNVSASVKDRVVQLIMDIKKYNRLFGSRVVYWTTDNKPEGYENKTNALNKMRTITVPVWVIDTKGKKSSSRSLTVNSILAEEVLQIFNEIYELPEQFPIDTLTGFRWNSRGEVSGPFLENVTCMSAHAYGAAIDINYYQNDYYLGKGNDLRDVNDPYYITDNVKNIFLKHGWYWGGDYGICSDTQHFQYTGLGMLSYNTGNPFTEYTVNEPAVKSIRIKNVRRRLEALGYACGGSGTEYDEKTEAAVIRFQEDNGLKVTGTTTEEFYILLYNMTNTMYDVKA